MKNAFIAIMFIAAVSAGVFYHVKYKNINNEWARNCPHGCYVIPALQMGAACRELKNGSI